MKFYHYIEDRQPESTPKEKNLETIIYRRLLPRHRDDKGQQGTSYEYQK